MPVSPAARHIYGRKILTFTPGDTFTAIDHSTATKFCTFACPVSGNLKKISFAQTSSDGTTPTQTAQVMRGSTVIASVVTPADTTGIAVAASSELTVPVSVNEPLALLFKASNSDNNPVGVCVSLEFEHDLGDE